MWSISDMADSFVHLGVINGVISVLFRVFGVLKGYEVPVIRAGFRTKVSIILNTPKYTEITLFYASWTR